MEDGKKMITIRCTPELHAALTESAEKHVRSLNGQVIWLLEAALNKEG